MNMKHSDFITARELEGKTVKDFTARIDPMMGTLYFSSKKSKNVIYATPFFENSNTCPIELILKNGYYVSAGEINLEHLTKENQVKVILAHIETVIETAEYYTR